MCFVTATELKQNLSYYMEKSLTEDVYVTKNKKIITVLVNPQKKALEELIEMGGCLKGKIPDDVDYKDVIGEGIMKKCGF